jgi:hypothetical protein
MSTSPRLAVEFAREISAVEPRNNPINLSNLELSLLYWAVRRDLKNEIAAGHLDIVDTYVDVIEVLAVARLGAA